MDTPVRPHDRFVTRVGQAPAGAELFFNPILMHSLDGSALAHHAGARRRAYAAGGR